MQEPGARRVAHGPSAGAGGQLLGQDNGVTAGRLRSYILDRAGDFFLCLKLFFLLLIYRSAHPHIW